MIPTDHESTGDRQPETKMSTRLIVTAGLIIVALWLGTFALVALGPWELTRTGPFGDSFGALNTLFSGSAFALLIYTAYLQKSELEEQRHEVRMTRLEVAEQTKQFRIQTGIFEAQLEEAKSNAATAAAAHKTEVATNRALTVEAMTDQTLAMLLRTLASDASDIQFQPVPQLGPTLSGWAGLRELWIHARNFPGWNKVPVSASDEREAARKIFDEFIARKGKRLFGDAESLVRIWALSGSMLNARGFGPESSQGLLVREFHPRELGFLLYIVAMVRNEKPLIGAAKEFQLLDRCVAENVLHSKHVEFLFAIDS